MLESPEPAVRPGGILVRNAASLISSGTERAKIEMAQASLLGKARMRPDLVREVFRHIRQEGVLTTYRKAMARLDTPVSLGYCCAGTVIEVGQGVEGFRPGDRVACAGDGYACHAEIVSVPKALCVKVPDKVSLEEAAFAPLGAIALQAVRQAKIELGDRVAVIGLGLVGLLVVQVLKATGCVVLGIDINARRLDIAGALGADLVLHRHDDPVVPASLNISHDRGLDAVIIAAATDSSDPVELAGVLCREKGRVVIVGAVPIHVPRRSYYEKELELVVSRAFGPGTYDPTFVEKGQDYPAGYVRWTATRNMEAFLNLVSTGKVSLGPVITHRLPIERALEGYDLISNPGAGALGVLFTYDPVMNGTRRRKIFYQENQSRPEQGLVVSFIGAGRFACNTLIPIFKAQGGVRLGGVATTTSIGAANAARKFGFSYASTDAAEILQDRVAQVVVIATPHDQHAALAMDALKAGKWVFVEKPLCLNEKELMEISQVLKEAPGRLMVGFNRRFSPLVARARDFLAHRSGPLVMHYRVNAGPLPADHWAKDPQKGGGRLLGEGCHFVDLLCSICGHAPVRVSAEEGKQGDDFLISLTFQDGSIGGITYTGQGDPSFSRELFEGFADGRTCTIENFWKALLVNDGRSRRLRRWRQALGYDEEIASFLLAIRGGHSLPIPTEDLVYSTLATLRAQKALIDRCSQKVDLSEIQGV